MRPHHRTLHSCPLQNLPQRLAPTPQQINRRIHNQRRGLQLRVCGRDIQRRGEFGLAIGGVGDVCSVGLFEEWEGEYRAGEELEFAGGLSVGDACGGDGVEEGLVGYTDRWGAG